MSADRDRVPLSTQLLDWWWEHDPLPGPTVLAWLGAAMVGLGVLLGILAVWTDSSKLGGTGGILGLAGVLALLAAAIWDAS